MQKQHRWATAANYGVNAYSVGRDFFGFKAGKVFGIEISISRVGLRLATACHSA
jgi:hypothetical protein